MEILYVRLFLCPTVRLFVKRVHENEIIVCQYINTVRYIDISSFLRPDFVVLSCMLLNFLNCDIYCVCTIA